MLNKLIHNGLVMVLMLFLGLFSYGQFEITKPVFKGSNNSTSALTKICASGGGASFNLYFGHNGTTLSTGNTFKVELSDVNGSFSSNPIILATLVSDYVNGGRPPNTDFLGTFPKKIFIPSTISGSDNYKVRIRASEHSTYVSPESDAIPIFYSSGSNPVLNNGNNVTICSGGSAVISVDSPQPGAKYIWVKDGYVVNNESGSALNVTQAGTYVVKKYLGSCSNLTNVESNECVVSVVSGFQASIVGGNTVELCSDQNHQLQVSVNNPDYTYTWYKDTQPLGVNTPTYTLPSGAAKYGKYYCEVEYGCKVKTQEVNVVQTNKASFSVKIKGESTRVILPNETVELLSEHSNLLNPTYKWFKNGSPITNAHQHGLSVYDEGEYVVEVTENSGACPGVKKSEKVNVLKAISFKPIIKTDINYKECVSNSTTLSIVDVKVKASDSKEYNLTPKQLTVLTYQWVKEGDGDVSGANANEYFVQSFNDNGKYKLKATSDVLIGLSDPLNVLLTKEGFELKMDPDVTVLCAGDEIKLYVELSTGNVNDYTYVWYKDGVEVNDNDADDTAFKVTEVGKYKVAFDVHGCKRELEVEIVPFDDSAIKFTPSSLVVVEDGKAIVSASGAESYEWYYEEVKPANKVFSGDQFDIDTSIHLLGKYVVVAKLGNCAVQKELTVELDDGKIVVQNTVSPNGDGVNDTWNLPNRFRKPSVSVVIYDTSGKELFNATEYENNWPADNNLRKSMLFYYRIFKDEKIVKSGTISVLD